ncbi:hypothetical protein TNCV_486011 [Trichonephila clavipes]|nr:hypothetical protein TNCV_486011 [Trichonephila clavipes]
MVMRERKGTIDGYEWRCRTKGGENPHDSMNEFAVKDVRVNKNTVVDWYMFCRRGHSLDDVFREFLRAITTLYPPMEKDVPS